MHCSTLIVLTHPEVQDLSISEDLHCFFCRSDNGGFRMGSWRISGWYFKNLNFASPPEFTFQMGDAAKELPCLASAVSYRGRSGVALLHLLHILLLHKAGFRSIFSHFKVAGAWIDKREQTLSDYTSSSPLIHKS